MRPNQLRNRIQHHLPTQTHNLNLDLLALLNRAHRSNRRIRTLVRQELSRPARLEAAFGVLAAGEGAGACCEDGFFAGLEVFGWYEEDELVAGEGGRGAHFVGGEQWDWGTYRGSRVVEGVRNSLNRPGFGEDEMGLICEM